MTIITDPDDIEDLFYGDEYKQVTDEEVVNTSRWSQFMEQILQHKPSGDYYRANWEVGATEYQEVDLEVELTPVFPKEITKTIYVTKDKL